MATLVTLTVLAFVIFPMLGAMIGASQGEAVEDAVLGFAVAFNFSVIAWIIFIAHHFIVKFW